MINSQSFRERQLLTEFATLRTAPIPGVYLSTHPSTPTTWYGVIFLRSPSNLYSNLPIRFTITFPTKYPEVPPFVVLHATSSGTDDIDRNWNGNGGVVIHPLVSRGGISNGRGFGVGYAAAHTGAVNLRDCHSPWFEPRGNVTITSTAKFGSIGRSGKVVTTTVSSPISASFGRDAMGKGGSGGKGGEKHNSAYYPPGTSPIEVIFWVRSIFTDKYLDGLQRRFEVSTGEMVVPNTPISPIEMRIPTPPPPGSENLPGESAVIVDDEAWSLWKNNREELKRRVEEVRKAGYNGGGVYQEWEGGAGMGGDVPIRFLDLERAALDTIKENLGRRLEESEAD